VALIVKKLFILLHTLIAFIFAMSVNLTIEPIKQILNANHSNKTDQFLPENIESSSNVPQYNIVLGKHLILII
jgi:hypothetical protein